MKGVDKSYHLEESSQNASKLIAWWRVLGVHVGTKDVIAAVATDFRTVRRFMIVPR